MAEVFVSNFTKMPSWNRHDEFQLFGWYYIHSEQGVSTVNLGVGHLVNNQHFRGGTKVVSIDSTSQVTVDRNSTNTHAVNNQSVKFMGPAVTTLTWFNKVDFDRWNIL